MIWGTRSARRLFAALGTIALTSAAPASATFLGLDAGDQIDTIGLSVPVGGSVYVDNAGTDTLDVTAIATDITTTPGSPGGPEVLTQIGGGAIDINLDLSSESLLRLSGGSISLFSYTGSFVGRSGVDDITLDAPVGGFPGQGGQTLVTGEITTTIDISVGFLVNIALNTILPSSLSFTATGTFNVTGGDPTFLQPFGNVGDLADIIISSTSSTPSVLALIADGHLYSTRTQNFSLCVTAGPSCSGAVTANSASHVSGGTGAISPQNAQTFVPEPSTALLLSFGLVGLSYSGRRRQERR